MPGRIEECLETTDASHIQKRSDDVRFALLLTYITLGWMTIEGAASLLLGWASKSLLLEAFGIDSVIELFSAASKRAALRPLNMSILLRIVQLVWLVIRFTR